MPGNKKNRPASIRARTTPNYRQRNLFSIIKALVDTKELKPGIVTRPILAAVAKIPTLTPELVTERRMAALLKRIGLTRKMYSRERQTAGDTRKPAMDALATDDFLEGFRTRDTRTREMKALARLATLAKHTTLTPGMVVKTLRPRPRRNTSKPKTAITEKDAAKEFIFIEWVTAYRDLHRGLSPPISTTKTGHMGWRNWAVLNGVPRDIVAAWADKHNVRNRRGPPIKRQKT